MKVGDVVRLKGGGPAMTVEQIDPELVSVAWFDCDNVLRRESFSKDLLTTEPWPTRSFA